MKQSTTLIVILTIAIFSTSTTVANGSENGRWQLLLENQQERLTEEDWNALDAATEIE